MADAKNHCFICFESIGPKTKINLLKQNSKHSKNSLYKIFKQLLGNEKILKPPQHHPKTSSYEPLPSSDEICACIYCVRKLNEYDYGTQMVKLVHNDILAIYELAKKKFENLLALKLDPPPPLIKLDDSPKSDFNVENQCELDEFMVSNKIKKEETSKSPNDTSTDGSDSADETLAAILNRKRRFYQPRLPYCKHCNLSFKNHDEFREHRKTKEHLNNFQKNLFKCLECKKRFRTQSALNAHIPAHKTELQLACKICGIKVLSKSALNGHLKDFHQDLKPFKCDHCDKSFKSASSLVRHQPAHTGEQRYCCDVCGKKFHEPSSFKLHNMMHQNIFTSECKICNLKFRLASHLKRHNLVHTGEKPHVCPYCNKSFAMRYNMNLHIRKIHKCINVNEIRCDRCNLIFMKRVLYARHLNSNCAEKEGGKNPDEEDNKNEKMNLNAKNFVGYLNGPNVQF